MTKSELHAQIDSMTDEEAAQVKLEIRKRTGTKPMAAGDFDREFGALPIDGEG